MDSLPVHSPHRGTSGAAARCTLLSMKSPAVGRDTRHIMDLDLALQRLAAREPRQARVVECRYFASLSEQESSPLSTALGARVLTSRREW